MEREDRAKSVVYLFFLRGTVHRCLLSIKKGGGQHSHLTVASDDNSLFLVCGNKPRYDFVFWPLESECGLIRFLFD